MKKIYLDHAAGTPVDPRVAREVLRGLAIVGNPSAFNDPGRLAAAELHTARVAVARVLGAHEDEVVFTSSGSESNMLAILGTFGLSGAKHREMITTPIEHPSVLEAVSRCASRGCNVRYVPVDERGMVDVRNLEKLLTPKTLLVSVMYANNEIGTIEPIAAIGLAIKKFRTRRRSAFPLFHVDACQAAEYLDMNVNRMGADLVTFNGAKIYGPRGVGVLYVRRGVVLEPQVLGGGQERGRRAGTENLPAILGLVKAISLIDRAKGKTTARLRDLLISGIASALPDAVIHGALGRDRLPNNASMSIPDLDSERLLVELDRHGIAAGSGSACTARSVEPSHVLKAIGVKPPYLDGVLRLSLGRGTTASDIRRVLGILPRIVADLRRRYAR